MTGVSQRFDLADETALEEGLTAATAAIRNGEVVVIPTDTVYGVAADAFDPAAVHRLLDVKGRGREMPPPVLIGGHDTVHALAADVPEWVNHLISEAWPGPLTVILHQQPSLAMDLGETRGTIAVRMPDHEAALALLNRTGPLAVSSANLSGMPAATDADQAADMLGERVSVILDGGATPGEIPSTIVDCTQDQARVLRVGALSVQEITDLIEAGGGTLEGPETASDA